MTGAEKKLIGRFARLHQDVERGVVPRAADVTSMLRAAWAGKLLSAHGKPYEACLDLAFAETAGVARGKVRASLLAGLEGLLRHDISAMSHFRSTLDALAPEARRLAWATDYLESETCTSSEDARSIIDTLWTRKPARSTRLYLALLEQPQLTEVPRPPTGMVPLVAEPLIDRLLDVVCAPGAPEMGHGTALSEVLAHPSNLGTTLAARLAPRTDEEVAMFLDTVSRFVARSKREGGFETELKQALETLKSLVPIVTARSLQVSPSVDAMLALLGARAARSTPALPRALPATVPEALELLATRGVKLKPATHVPKGLPADLAAFYARATALPFFIVKPTELAKAQRALLREVEGLNPGDGVTLDTLSPPKRWVALGTDAAGDHLFLDPAHPNFTFRFIHDEQEFDVEPCLAQLLCWFGARPWADEHLLTDALTTAYLTAKKRAEKAWKKNRR